MKGGEICEYKENERKENKQNFEHNLLKPIHYISLI